MTTTINDTIRAELERAGYGSYVRYADTVILALEQREVEISQKLLTYAVEAGISQEQAEQYLHVAGLTVPGEDDSDVDEERGEGLTQLERIVGQLAQQVDSLTAFARRNGYRD